MAKINTASLEFNDPNGHLLHLLAPGASLPIMSLFNGIMENPTPAKPHKEPVYQEPDVDEPTVLISYYEAGDPKAWWMRMKKTDYFCPCCGNKEVVQDINLKEYDEGPDMLVNYCIHCFYSWELGEEDTRAFISRTLLPNSNENQSGRNK